MDKLKKNKSQVKKTNNIDKNSDIKKKKVSNVNLNDLQKELKQAKDDSLRHLAEIDNLRKRFDKEREDTFKYAVTEFANEIILVADNFTRVIDSMSLIKKDINDNAKPLIDGIDLIFKDFIKTLEKFDVKKIECLGKKFDPNGAYVKIIELSDSRLSELKSVFGDNNIEYIKSSEKNILNALKV